MISSSRLRGLSIAACIGLGSAGIGCSEPEAPPELPPRAIRWQRVSDAVPEEKRVISGIVTAISDTRLAFEVGGIVASVEVNLGDVVERDQVLARLDPEPFELSVRDAEAEMARSQALAEASLADFERTTELFEASVASRQELDRDRARRDSQASLVKASHARLNLARRDLRRSVLRAPFNGTISVREVDPAMKMGSGETAIEMDSGEAGLRVEVQMPETLIARVRQGDIVTVTFPSIAPGAATGTDHRVEAVVSEVGTRAGAGNAFPVRADLKTIPAGLRSGMTAEISFSLPTVKTEDLGVDGFMIPLAAVRAERDEEFVTFVFDAETSTVRRTPVRSGGVRDNEVAILSGLELGDIIATAGVSFLRDGQTVRLGDDRLELRQP